MVISDAGTRKITVVNKQQKVESTLHMVLVGSLCRDIIVAIPTTVRANIFSPIARPTPVTSQGPRRKTHLKLVLTIISGESRL